MRLNVVEVDAIKRPIQKSPGFAKKGLSDYKLDACGKCEFTCTYCSSNSGNYLRINRERFAKLTEAQLGRRVLPSDGEPLMFKWRDLELRLQDQLEEVRPGFGAGQTLVYSMLTDGFSPSLVKEGVTERTLQSLVDHTRFRIRVLTKNAVVGSPRWISFFLAHRERFVVGLSIGTIDDTWARSVERGTSSPSARLNALRKLQEAGVPTYGMLCPVFPDMLEDHGLQRLIERIRPDRLENVWAEPYNERANWEQVRAAYDVGSFGYNWFTEVFQLRRTDVWSRYATDLYVGLRDQARREGWLGKLRFLLYEADILPDDARRLGMFEGLLLQSKQDEDGRSRNPDIAKMQTRLDSCENAGTGTPEAR